MIEIKNKKVLVLGLGLHGGSVSVIKWLSYSGAKIIVSDIKKKSELLSSIEKISYLKNIKYTLGKHTEKDVKWADFVVYSPGVPKESKYLQLARRLNKPVYNEASLFFDRCLAKTIAVTGTRGKSTTSSLIAEILKQSNKRVVLAGNIRTCFMMDIVDRAKKDDIIVLELSSWQLEGLNIVHAAPNVAVVTNLYPDHLNRYRNLAHYYCSKKEIFRHQSGSDSIILNYDDEILKDWSRDACSKSFYFSKKDRKNDGSFIKKGHIFFRQSKKEEKIMPIKNIFLKGEHNLENVLAAVCASKLFKASSKDIRKGLEKEIVIDGRQEEIAEISKIKFINDTTSTTPDAGIAALKRFSKIKKNIILIAGGADKKLDYEEWCVFAKKHCKRIYLLAGSASKKMEKCLSGFKNLSTQNNDLKFVCKDAFKCARSGDIILFSPSAASFNLWNHEFHRGEDFKKAVYLISDQKQA